jgi:uncharacterized membrane-anchored protein YhcB (DUF1043 family)
MVSLRKTRKNRSKKKLFGGRISTQKKSPEIKKLEDEIKELKNKINNSEKKKKTSGHVEAGKKWNKSDKGRQWSQEIESARKYLGENINPIHARILASEIRKQKKLQKSPEEIQQYIDNYKEKVLKNIQEKTSEKKEDFKEVKPLSPELLYTQNNIQKTPLIGGFFDDSSDDD